MKRLFLALLVAVSAMSVAVSNVEAKRLGGGTSIGKQSQSVNRAPAPSNNQATNAAKPAPAATPGAIPPKPASPWKGILGGALAGLGIAALMSHFGLGGAMGSMIGTILMFAVLAMVVMFLLRMFRGKSSNAQPAFAGAYSGGTTPEIGSRLEPVSAAPMALQGAAPAAAANAAWDVPADFDVPGFVRNAKTYFIRLQAAWDKADIDDIREFSTPEMFAELRLQVHERGASANHTDVVSLDAELMGIETVGKDYLASVRFSGMIKEAQNAPAEPFTEVWNLVKPTSGQGGWLLAGIQQLDGANGQG